MPLVECPECKKSVSSEARACPFCGYPVAEKLASQSALSGNPAQGQGELLLEARPSWWGYFWHIVFFWLLVPIIIAVFKRNSVVLRVFEGRITIERGIFSKCYQDYTPKDIRSVDVDQSFVQRMVGIGNITLSTAATAEGSESIKSIADPHRVRELILAQRGVD